MQTRTTPAAATSNAPVETVAWKEVLPTSTPYGRTVAAMVYDSVRGKTVLVGGAGIHNDTWEWDGQTWTRRRPTTSAPLTHAYALSFDRRRGRVVLVVGSSYGETWEFDGSTWEQKTLYQGPNAGDAAFAIAFDEARGVTVLMATEFLTSQSVVWTWDGTTWRSITPPVSPPWRRSYGLAYDAARQRVVLFGGVGYGIFSDTWEWDGATWTERTPSTTPSPPPRYGHSLVYDRVRQRILLMGGYDDVTTFSDVWAWDGERWTALAAPSSPPDRTTHGLAFDEVRDRLVVFAGISIHGQSLVMRSDTWEWDGELWTEYRVTGRPPHRVGAAVAFDPIRRRTLLFGGYTETATLADTWEWDGTAWAQRWPIVSPPPRAFAAVTFDPSRGVILLYGGEVVGSVLRDTWEWDGLDWSERTFAPGPAPSGGAMAYDEARGEVVLLGGDVSGYALYSETWVLGANGWNQRTLAVNPYARGGHALAYDSARGKIVLFGGAGFTDFYDTWEWDGVRWSDRTDLHYPTPWPRADHKLVYDKARSKTILFGGDNPRTSGRSSAASVWEWDGNRWTERQTALSPTPRMVDGLVYDEAKGEVSLFGSLSVGFEDDVWTLSAYGGACTTDAQCDTGHCVDGVCCQSACGGGALRGCGVCSVALGATADGVCSPKPDGTVCDDGNPNTVQDACTGGVCAGVDRCLGVVCVALDQCHKAGRCIDHASGACSNPPKRDGARCDDGDPNTVEDVCTAGVCGGVDRCVGVVCAASDQCHEVGRCIDHESGACSNPPKPDGTPCDDGNPNTVRDVCTNGACAGVDRCVGVVCAALDQCHVAGACIDHESGACSNPPKPDGTPCDDGNPNTVQDACANGVCVGVDRCVGVVCAALDQCHVAGACIDHATGACSNPAKADGTPCDDGNPNTVQDVCTNGACAGVDRCIGVVCAALDQCHVAGACIDHATGACSNPTKADGTPCDDGNPNTVQDGCTGGLCAGVDRCAGVVCAASDQCHEVGRCIDHASGACSNPPKPDGTACDDGACQSGRCVGAPRVEGAGCSAVAGAAPLGSVAWLAVLALAALTARLSSRRRAPRA